MMLLQPSEQPANQPDQHLKQLSAIREFGHNGETGSNRDSTVGFELSYGDIGILFFLTLGPLKAILPFARVTRGTEPAFQRTVAWQAMAIATVIVVVVALFGPFILTNWHVSPPAIIITGGIILFYQALRIIT